MEVHTSYSICGAILSEYYKSLSDLGFIPIIVCLVPELEWHIKPHFLTHVSKIQAVFSSSQTSKPQFLQHISQGSDAFSLIPSDIDGSIVSFRVSEKYRKEFKIVFESKIITEKSIWKNLYVGTVENIFSEHFERKTKKKAILACFLVNNHQAIYTHSLLFS